MHVASAETLQLLGSRGRSLVGCDRAAKPDPQCETVDSHLKTSSLNMFCTFWKAAVPRSAPTRQTG